MGAEASRYVSQSTMRFHSISIPFTRIMSQSTLSWRVHEPFSRISYTLKTRFINSKQSQGVANGLSMDHRYVISCFVFFPYVNLQMMSGHQTFTIGRSTITVEMMQIVRTTDIIHNATSTDLPPYPQHWYLNFPKPISCKKISFIYFTILKYHPTSKPHSRPPSQNPGWSDLSSRKERRLRSPPRSVPERRFKASVTRLWTYTRSAWCPIRW